MTKKIKVNWELEGNVAIIIIDNPPVNAMSTEVAEQLYSCLQEIERFEEIRCVVISSIGAKFFMAGAEIKQLIGSTYIKLDFVFNYIDFYSRPIIIAVQGMALGGGTELMLCCDICIAAENACFGLPEIKLGLIPGGGGTQRLPRRVGEIKAKELMFLGDFIPAEEALRIGLINQVVPEGKALDEAKKMAGRIAAQPGVAINLIKQCVERGLEVPLMEGLKIEADLFARVFRTADGHEGVTAFLEKRKANFKHK